MTDDSPPIGGRARAPARHIEAPCGLGWDPLERCDWEAIAAVLPPPWPPGAQRQDLRYWAARERRRSCNRPSYRELAARWGVTEKGARLVCADVEWWADPRFGDERPERASQRGSSGADEGQTKGRRRADEGQTKGRPTPDAHAVVEHKGAGQGQTKGRPRADEGQAKGSSGAPIEDRDRDKNSHTDREAHTSASPPESAEKRRPTAAERATAEAEDLLRRLDALRLQRHPSGRPLKAETWVPKLRTALKRQSAQEVIDGWTWVLRSPEAAWHRGEARGGTDRTRDLALVLGHPEYAARRTWRGLEAAHEHDLEARPAESLPVQVWPLTPYQIAAAERERREQEENEVLRRKLADEAQRRRAELGIEDDDDICF